MRILKIKGKSEEIIYEQIKKEYGESALILSTQKEKEKGILNWFRPTKTVVTVAVPENEPTFAEKLEEKVNQNQTLGEPFHISMEMLNALKIQMNEMQASLAKLSHVEGNDTNKKFLEYSEADKMKDLLNKKLIEQGLQQEVIDKLMRDNQEEDIEGIVRFFYSRVEELLTQSVDNSRMLPKVVFFVGPTGVGKTTTIAKLTADYVLNRNKKVVLFTSDTYRIAAIDQLKTYADILGVSIEIIYEEKELLHYLDKWQDIDHIFIDTAGRSHKNVEQLKDVKFLIDSVSEKEVLLVMNASTAYKDVKKIIETYEGLCGEFKLIITKLDETDQIGNILNIAYSSQKPILYLTVGQNVPADIITFEVERYTSDLLGRINYE
ncbi:flagellar biosynthesis protein FlhF [Sporanaerobium hydrogeniformans]|uniref:Flagellar biosynthesis protein FlhF n=1 Tax=Sporanaerobium hydrogeniformans TaxID=3072179 RepID=A0AC61DEX5_9FIRM|nr:flagellar biosynthesis protein FlhF [Sporanaerobium hydrogeniformans]PHV71760.1 flagellar biosynthesis protein FlhF [Sporanaerobium hydrogeniformans]